MEQQHIYDWISTIIESCRDDFHFEGVDRLIDLFHTKYSNEDLTFELISKRTYKWNDIHAIIEPKLNK
jgi:hypothetical protein